MSSKSAEHTTLPSIFVSRSDYQRVREQFDPSVFATLSEDLSAYLEDMAHADYALRCRGQDFPCHKFILAAR